MEQKCDPGVFAADELAAAAGPTPAEIDTLAWAAIEEGSRRRRCAGARALNAFTRDVAHASVTPKGDDRTNIIDQGARVTYALPAPQRRQLYGKLEAARLEGTVAHFSERQGTGAAPRCGLMLDYDICTQQRRPAITDRHYHRMAAAVAGALQRDVDFAPRPAEGKDDKTLGTSHEHILHIAFIVKAEAVALPAEATGPPTYKFGFHILVPGVKLARAYKKWLLRQFRADPGMAATLQELGAVGDPAACLDQNSASVPVLFFGSCKRGGAPYALGAVFEVALDVVPGGAAWAAPPVVRRLDERALAGRNLVAELALNDEAEYDDREPLIRKREFDCQPAAAAAAQDWGDRAAGGALAADELLLAEHALAGLTLHDAEARHVHTLLDLLGPEFAAERNRWRDVVYAIAHTSEAYKPLAIWFSQKCPAKWADGGAAALDALWEEAVARRAAPAARPLTLRSLAYWARAADPARYTEAMERSYFTLLTGYVYDHGGKLEHYMVAKVLYAMLGSKFCVDVDTGPRGRQDYCWYEFVLPGVSMKPGEVWKWRREMEPDEVQIYMSEKFTRVLDQISEHIEERRTGAADEEQAKYYKDLGKSFAGSKKSMYNDTFKNAVVRQANFVFRRRGFAEQLDRHPLLFGVANGVLRLGPRCELIDHYHEYAVSQFTPVAYRRLAYAPGPRGPAAPVDPWVRLALDAIADIIPEPDARDWILYHAAQGVSGEPKEGLLLFWEGGGQNGKTSFLRWVAKALGPKANKFNIQLLCSEREEADRPNSALMTFKHLNYAYCEESNKAQVLNVARMKEMVNAGEVSGRDLNSKQETFTMKVNVVAASQYSFIVDTTDHGTWRRLRHYTSKTKFRKDPDPTNPFEKKDDQRFVRTYPDDPMFQSAILAILVLYFERLQAEHGGELKNVRSFTIESESEAFRVSQDSLHRWLCEAIVVSPGNETHYALGVLGGYYTEWYGANIGKKQHVAGEIIKEIASSVVGKFLKIAPNRTLGLSGCRVLTAAERELGPGEELLNNVAPHGEALAGDAFGVAAGDPRFAWWEPRTEGAAAPERKGDDDRDLWPDDDAAIMAADRLRKTAPPAAPVPDVTMDEMNALVEEAAAAANAAQAAAAARPPAAGLDDVYA